MVIHAGEFSDCLAGRKFVFDGALYPRHESKNLSNKQSCNQARSPPASLGTEAMDFVI
jgi:hypothetical protein